METTTTVDFVIEPPNVEHLVTEDDTPVDNIFSEKQQRLLVDTLHSAKPFGDRPFVASANVGIYYAINKPAVVPDVFVSLIWEKAHRVYMVWQIGKVPEVVIEIVSNTVGHEGGKKFDIYAKMGVPYYIVFDPIQHINKEKLNIYELHVGEFYRKESHFLEKVGIGLTLWEGQFEERVEEWLRWTDAEGNLLMTGFERAEKEKQRAEQEKQRAEKLAEKLRSLGINPEEI
jgi:Uma2 family endonuclease